MEKEKITEFQKKWGHHRNGKCSKCNFEGEFPIIQNYVEPFGAGNHFIGCILLLFGLIFGIVYYMFFYSYRKPKRTWDLFVCPNCFLEVGTKDPTIKVFSQTENSLLIDKFKNNLLYRRYKREITSDDLNEENKSDITLDKNNSNNSNKDENEENNKIHADLNQSYGTERIVTKTLVCQLQVSD